MPVPLQRTVHEGPRSTAEDLSTALKVESCHKLSDIQMQWTRRKQRSESQYQPYVHAYQDQDLTLIVQCYPHDYAFPGDSFRCVSG